MDDNIIFPCRPGNLVYVPAEVDGKMEMVPAIVESVDCQRNIDKNGVFTYFRVYVEHEHVKNKAMPHLLANRHIFFPEEIYPTKEASENPKKCNLETDRRFEYTYQTKFKPGDTVFIGAKKDFLYRPVCGRVLSARIILDERDEALTIDEVFIVEHEFTHRHPGDKEKSVHPRNRDFFTADELFASQEEAKAAIAS